jgi:ABC-type multidrug transport system fused ATPase/permease subunit
VTTAQSTVDGAPTPTSEPVRGRGTLRRGLHNLWRFVRMEPRPFTIAVIGSTVYATTAVIGTFVLGRVTDEVLEPAFSSGVSDATVWAWVALIIGVAMLRSAGVVARRFFGATTSRRIQATLRRQIADRYLSVPLAYHRERATGELLAHADADVEAATEVINPLPFSTGLVVLILFSVVALFLIDPVLALVGLVLFPVMAGLNRYYTRRVETPAAAVQRCVGEVSAIAHESFDGALVVKTLGLEQLESDRLAEAAERLRVERVQVGRLRAFFEPTLDALPNLGIVAILAIGAWRISESAITTGQLVTAMALFTLLAFPMRVVGFLLEEMPRSIVSLERVDRVLEADDAESPTDPATLDTDGAVRVAVDDVEFAHPGAEPVLRDCTLTLAAGEIVALVGPTGSGKSTLCELIVGLVHPSRGTVAVDGVDLRRLDHAHRRALMALVFQESFLFADSIAENVLLGTEPDPARLALALEVAQAARFVAALPQGADTVVGERGVTLSGGQRQRVALARAIARRPRLLLLDDATSAVDPTVEARILAKLRDELRMTTLVVAHRVSTIRLADRVLHMDDGRIVQSGTHEELLASDPAYAAMVQAYEQEPAPIPGGEL